MTTEAGAGGLVVLAEPDDEFRAFVAGHLRRSGFVVREVETGEAALELVRREAPVATVLEVTLPDVSGYELCRLFREELGEWMAILLISRQRAEARDRVAGLLMGADDYLSTPFEPDELIARVLSLVRRQPEARSAARGA